MVVKKTKSVAKIDQLIPELLSTLDESLFFSILGDFLKSSLKVERCDIFLLVDEKSVGHVYSNGAVKTRKMGPSQDVLSILKKIVRNKTPHFSNESGEKMSRARMSIPIMAQGKVFAVVLFQTDKKDCFQKKDAAQIVSFLKKLDIPLKNIRTYLTAKNQNQALRKQIKQKAKLSLEATGGGSSAEKNRAKESLNLIRRLYRVEEKPIISKSLAMKEVLHLSDRVAQNNVGCLIQGEMGTGREMIAKRIHCRSPRKDFGFASIDCSVLSSDKLEIEIFGREEDIIKKIRGSIGLIETIDKGTLFLNNIEYMSIPLQSKLNDFINGQPVLKFEGSTPITSSTCIIASCGIDIREKVRGRFFREDLFYTLNKMNISMPALQDRWSDIELLATEFLRLNKGCKKVFSLEAVKDLQQYSWPGNVRELRSVIERAQILCDGDVIERKHLPSFVVSGGDSSGEASVFPFRELSLRELERLHISAVLKYLNGNKTQTAQLLGITLKTLYNKIHRYDLDKSA